MKRERTQHRVDAVHALYKIKKPLSGKQNPNTPPQGSTQSGAEQGAGQNVASPQAGR